MQVTIARQLGLEPTTVGNFFMNARRRSHDKWREGPDEDMEDMDEMGEHDPNIKYEVWDDGMEAYQDNYTAAMGAIQEHQDPNQGYHMTSIPAAVHNPHNQMQSYPSTCA
jgi:hypothetical protein